MTIASEITRLQWAKADIKTSIENKGVAVPSDAKLDDYSSYVDQIQQGDGGVLSGWLRLYDNYVSSKDGTPRIKSSISWVEWNKYYWCAVYSLEWASASSLESGVYTYRKVDTTNDMAYKMNNVTWDQSSGVYSEASKASFWKNWTNMKIIFFVDSTRSSNRMYCYQAIWDYKTTWTTTNSLIWRGETTNISDYSVDLTGYTQLTTNERVKSVTGHEEDDDAYIYLTLK